MRAEELSVGNYVFALALETEGSDNKPNGLVKRYPVQIETIFGDTILDNYGCEHDIKNGIEPIPLTREILEKSFTNQDNNYVIYEDFYFFGLREYLDGVWQAIYKNCEMSGIPHDSLTICFVHQLQRMMTDCYCDEYFQIDLEDADLLSYW